MPDTSFTDNSDEVFEELARLSKIALREVGREAEGIAKENCTAVDTGRLRNSITFATAEKFGQYNYRNNFNESYNDESKQPEEDAVYIGTNVEYAPFIELGHKIAGQKPVAPGNRSKNHSKGHGKSVPPLHFLKNAAGNHTEHYKRIIDDIMHGDDN